MKKGLLIALAVVVVLGLGGYIAYSALTAPTKGPSQMTPPPGGPGMGNRQPPPPLADANQPVADQVTLSDGQQLYRIDSSTAIATFTLNEQLRGEPKTVVGTSTGMIAGDIGLNPANLASSTIGTIKINARTFITDDNSRNNMIRRAILKTENDANEFITFKPDMIMATSSGFAISGDLTIAGVTKPETFTATSTLAADGTLSVHASTMVTRGDFNLVIPNIPFIANVQDQVLLDLQLIAQPVKN